jgi:hypothetical protein
MLIPLTDGERARDGTGFEGPPRRTASALRTFRDVGIRSSVDGGGVSAGFLRSPPEELPAQAPRNFDMFCYGLFAVAVLGAQL